MFFSNNIAQKWQDWTVQAAKNPDEQQDDFRINPKGNTEVSVFMEKLAELSEQFVEQYDSDKDGKISYDEFEKYEEQQLNENSSDIDEETLEAAKKALQTTYARLDIDKDGESKDGLDKREIMNYFHTMDALNDEFMNDGMITKEEYIDMTDFLSDTTPQVGGKLSQILKYQYEHIFKDYDK